MIEDLSVTIKADTIMFALEIYYAMQCLLRVVQFESQKYIAIVTKLILDEGKVQFPLKFQSN